MTKNLETAEKIVKLALAFCTVVFYFTRVISGPIATLLMILGLLVIGMFAVRVLVAFLTRD